MKKVLLTIELTLGDLSEEERNEIVESLPTVSEDDEEQEEFETLPRIDEYSNEEVVAVMRDIFGDFGLTDPENSAEIFAGTDFYATIAKSRVLACTVEDADDSGSD